MLACWHAAPALSQSQSSQSSLPVQRVHENDLKAAFVFNFAVFTEWPQEALAGSAPISLCASAANPMLGALDKL